MMLNVSREFMFWPVFCTLNQCIAFTGWEQNVPWDLLQLKCLSITTSHPPPVLAVLFWRPSQKIPNVSALCQREGLFIPDS